jgi:hypothetical protein
VARSLAKIKNAPCDTLYVPVALSAVNPVYREILDIFVL